MSREKQIDYKEFARQMRQVATVFNGTEPAVVCSKELWESIASAIEGLAGYRKQSEGEWIWDKEHSNYKCGLCGEYDTTTPTFCRGFGAKMKGGAG